MSLPGQKLLSHHTHMHDCTHTHTNILRKQVLVAVTTCRSAEKTHTLILNYSTTRSKGGTPLQTYEIGLIRPFLFPLIIIQCSHGNRKSRSSLVKVWRAESLSLHVCAVADWLFWTPTIIALLNLSISQS